MKYCRIDPPFITKILSLRLGVAQCFGFIHEWFPKLRVSQCGGPAPGVFVGSPDGPAIDPDLGADMAPAIGPDTGLDIVGEPWKDYHDVSDEDWDQLKPLLPETMGEDRGLISGLLWVYTTRERWQDMPEQAGYWPRYRSGYCG